jgi:hypothetical protein
VEIVQFEGIRIPFVEIIQGEIPLHEEGLLLEETIAIRLVEQEVLIDIHLVDLEVQVHQEEQDRLQEVLEDHRLEEAINWLRSKH